MVNTFQTGNISSVLGLDIKGLAFEEPVPPPTLPELLTDSESRVSLSEDGTTYAERSVKNDLTLLQELLLQRELAIPAGLKIVYEPFIAKEMMSMEVFPRIYLVDEDNHFIKNVGDDSDPWLVTVSLVQGPGTLLGNTSAPIVNGFASFDDIRLDQEGQDYQLRFEVSYPNVILPGINSFLFDVDPRPLSLKFLNESILIPSNQTFSVSLAIWDVALNQPADSSVLSFTSWDCQLQVLPSNTSLTGTSEVSLVSGKSFSF